MPIISHKSWYPPTVLNIPQSTQICLQPIMVSSPHSTEHPAQYSDMPPHTNHGIPYSTEHLQQYENISPPTVLNIPHSTKIYPPTVLNIPHSTQICPHTQIMVSPTALNIPHSTKIYPPTVVSIPTVRTYITPQY